MHFTQNPIGSDSPLDLQDNAISFDYALNSPAGMWEDRFGKQHKTMQQALKDVGFKPAGFDFVSGGTLGIGDRDKCVFYPTDGYWYSWDGKLPYVVPANSTPTPGGKKGWKASLIQADTQYTTVAELLNGRYRSGTHVVVIDRGFGVFLITPGETHNGMDKISAGFGKTAVYVINGPVNVVHLGAKSDYILGTGQNNPNKTENSVFINRALELSLDVYIPDGTFFIAKHIRLKNPRVKLSGAGIGNTTIVADGTMEGTTIGGSSGTVLIWYQPDGNFEEISWVEGGIISDMSIVGSSASVEGIRINRVCQSQKFSNLRIAGCSKGIYGTHFGWGTTFDNLYIHDCPITAIHLTGAYNGCTFTGVKVWGGDLPNYGTQVLVLIENDSIGNNWSGGYIEKGLVGVRLSASQLNITGCDFEGINDSFIQVTGRYDGNTLISPAPPSAVNGCTFVGAPWNHGVYAKGGQITVSSNNFINNDPIPNSTTRAIFGDFGGGAYDGFGYPCVSEFDNGFFGSVGWGNQISDGIIFTRAKKYAAEGYMFPVSAGETPEQKTISDYNGFKYTGTGITSNTTEPYGLTQSNAIVTKIGDHVSVNLSMIVSSVPGSGAYVLISDLPYPPNSSQRVIGEFVVGVNGNQQMTSKHGKIVFFGNKGYLSTSGDTPSLLLSLAVGDIIGITLNYHV